MKVRIELFPEEGSQPLEEIPDPLRPERVISVTARTWGKAFDHEQSFKQYMKFLGFEQREGEWVLDKYAEIADVVGVVPARLRFRVVVEGAEPDVPPDLWVLRVPAWDVVMHPLYYYAQATLAKPQLSWSEADKAWVGEVELLLRENSSQRTSKENSLLRSNSAVIAAVAFDGKESSFDFIRARLLPPKIDPKRDLDLSATLITNLLARAVETYDYYILDFALPTGSTWSSFVERTQFPASREELIRRTREILRDPELLRGVSEKLLSQTTLRLGDDNRMSWFDFVQGYGFPALEAALALAVEQAARELSGKEKSLGQRALEALQFVTLGVAGKAAPTQVTGEEFRELYDKLLATWSSANLRLISMYESTLEESGETITWAVAQERVGEEWVPKAYRIRLEGDSAVLEELDPSFIEDEEVKETIAKALQAVVQAQPVAAQAQQSPSPLTGVTMGLPLAEEAVCQTIGRMALAHAALDLIPEHISRADVLAFLQGYSPWNSLRVYSLLTGSQVPSLPVHQFNSMQAAAGKFLDAWEAVWQDYKRTAGDLLERVRPFSEMVFKLGAERVKEMYPAPSLYSTFLLSLAAHQYQFKREDPLKKVTVVPWTLGWVQVLRWTNIDELLTRYGWQEYLPVREPLWQIWYTSIVETKPGQPEYVTDIYKKIWEIRDSLAEGKEVPEETVQLLESLQQSPDAFRMPLVKEATSYLLQALEPGAKAEARTDTAVKLAQSSILSLLSFFERNHWAEVEQGFKQGLSRLTWALRQDGLISDAEAKTLEEQASSLAKQAYQQLYTTITPGNVRDLLTPPVSEESPTTTQGIQGILQQAYLSPETWASRLGDSLGTRAIRLTVDPERFLRAASEALDQLVSAMHDNPQVLSKSGLLIPQDMPQEEALSQLDEVYRLYRYALTTVLTLKLAKEAGTLALPLVATNSPAATTLTELDAQAAQFRVKAMLREALQTATSFVRSEIQQKYRWDFDRTSALMYRYLCGWLALPWDEQDESFWSQRFEGLTPYLPFIGEWGHTEQRIFLRVAISTVGTLGAVLSGLLAGAK